MIMGTGTPVGGTHYAGGMGTSGGAFGTGGYPISGAGGGQIQVAGGDAGCCGPSGGTYAAGRGVGFGGPGMGQGTTVVANPGCGIGSGASDTSCCVGGPEASCGGLGSACFEGAGTMVGTGDWTYVGEGRGTHTGPGGYNFVGAGAGNWTKEAVATPYGCRLRPCCLLLSLLLLLLALVPFLMNYFSAPSPTPMPAPPPAPPMRIPVPVPAPRPPPPPPISPPPPVPVPVPVPAPVPAQPAYGGIGSCIGWGDPHVRTFDGMRADYYSSGEYYIVKSNVISIQGRYLPTKFTNGLAVTKMVAIGGSLLKGNKLIIGPLSATWNGAPILTGFPSHFDQPDIVHADYDNVGNLVDTALDASKKKIVHVKINDGSPEGLLVQVNRWTASVGNEYVNFKITMHSRPDQDGHCGNFNGNAADDDRMAVRQRVGTQGVPAGPELLFATKTPVTTAGRPDINNCPTATLEAAKTDCKAAFGGMSPKMSCLTDYCFAGKDVALNE
mmetsp:Transcript_55345/g.109994  ORF Transcript_55345/g.109994 Transcript_55345/m.109994 type:complete len:497 (-) Transcript_55345:84-1574(-)